MINIIQLTTPIDDYLNRQKSVNNELYNLRNKGSKYFLEGLKSHPLNGLTDEAATTNQTVYGKNQVSKRRLKTLFQFFCHTLEDLMLRILIVSAIISIILEGIFSEDRQTFWLEGVTILAAVAVCSTVAAINDYQKQKQFEQLNEISEQNNKYDIIRNGSIRQVNRESLVVGDIIVLKNGLEVPTDGLVVEANDLVVDESSMTGETHELHKNTYEGCSIHEFTKKDAPSPIIISGSKIMSGEGKLLTLVVGKNSRMGKLNELIQEQVDQKTPLEEKLDDLAEKIGLFGLISATLVFLLLVGRLLISDIFPNGWNSGVHLNLILSYLILAVAIVVVAVPEGLPLAVTLSLAFSVKQMLKENNLVKKLACCETMGSAHVICTDKTGTLTQNDMHVVEVWNGNTYANASITTAPFSNSRNPNYKYLIFNAICHNSSAVLEPKIKGSSTEVALLRYAKQVEPTLNLLTERAKHADNYFLRLPFNSDRKRITTGVKLNGKNYVFLTGGSEIVIEACSQIYDIYGQGKGRPINKQQISKQLDLMTKRGLRSVAIAVKQVPNVLSGIKQDGKDSFGVRSIQKSGFTLLLLAGIQDLPRPQSLGAIKQCNRAGVVVIMVTGDNSETARSIADQLGITKAGDNTKGLCMEGDQFEKLEENASPQEFYQAVKNLKILARSRPEHKHKLVLGLKKINNVVAVTGDGTNDAPALLKANVGVAMGISGTQVAKNAADILILDDNFNSIVRSIVWGRNIYDSVKKFLQFQLTVNTVACFISIISSALFRQSILTTVQMLWVNMIMDSLASLALATESPNTEQLLNRKPVKRSESLISKLMIKHVIGQSLFQIAILMILIMMGQDFLPEFKDEYDSIIGSDLSAKYHDGLLEGTMTSGLYYPLSGTQSYEPYFKKYQVYSRHFTFIFNAFVMMQVFNFFNCRKIRDEINIFTGLFKNYIFFLILGFVVIFQFVIIFFLNKFFNCYRYHGLTLIQWLWCIFIGFSVIPVSIILRFIPYGKQELIMDEINDEANQLEYRDPEQDSCDSDCEKEKENK